MPAGLTTARYTIIAPSQNALNVSSRNRVPLHSRSDMTSIDQTLVGLSRLWTFRPNLHAFATPRTSSTDPETLLHVQPINQLVIHHVSFPLQQHVQPPVPISHSRGCQIPQPNP